MVLVHHEESLNIIIICVVQINCHQRFSTKFPSLHNNNPRPTSTHILQCASTMGSHTWQLHNIIILLVLGTIHSTPGPDVERVVRSVVVGQPSIVWKSGLIRLELINCHHLSKKHIIRKLRIYVHKGSITLLVSSEHHLIIILSGSDVL